MWCLHGIRSISGDVGMFRKAQMAALPILLLLGLAGCSLSAPDPISTESTSETTTQTVTEPTETQPETTAPTTVETLPPQTVTQPEPDDDDFVKVVGYIPDIVIDLRYATENNFTGQQIYAFSDVWLRYGTVKKLMLVQEELKQNGYGLKLWDGFRPPSAQFKLWEICPDPAYVSNPNNGFSSHSRGNTVDITLVDSHGKEQVMPTGFDDFSRLADRDYSDCGEEAADARPPAQ